MQRTTHLRRVKNYGINTNVLTNALKEKFVVASVDVENWHDIIAKGLLFEKIVSMKYQKNPKL